MINNVLDLIRSHEGCRLRAYIDTEGVCTIGWGSTGPEITPGTIWTQAQADARLIADAEKAQEGAAALCGPRWHDLCAPRRAVLTDLVYQVGKAGAEKFARMLAAVQAGDWPIAAQELEDSKLAGQTPGRTRENADILRTGEWPSA